MKNNYMNINFHGAHIINCPEVARTADKFIESAAGDLIHLDDTQDGNIAVTGWVKNLIPFPYLNSSQTINGISINMSSDGTLHFSGSRNDADTQYFTIYANDLDKSFLKRGQRYTFSVNTNVNTGMRTYVAVRKGESLAGQIQPMITDRGSATFTIPEDPAYTRVYIGVYFNKTAGSMPEGSFSGIMLETGDTAHPYVPYAGYDITSCGKNLIYSDTIGSLSGTGGMLIEKAGDSYICNENSSQKSGSIAKMSLIPITRLKRGNYTCTIEVLGGTVTGNGGLGLMSVVEKNYEASTEYMNQYQISALHYISNGNVVPGGIKNATAQALGAAIQAGSKLISHFTLSEDLPDDMTIQFLIWLTADRTATDLKLRWQIEYGDVSTDYEPYRSSVVHVTNDTPAPVYGLKSFNGVTNIFADCGTELSVMFPVNDCGRLLVDTAKNVYDKLTELAAAIIVSGGED